MQKYKCLPTPAKKAIQLVCVREAKGKKIREPIEMEDILKPTAGEGTKARCVLIEGEHGVGKSTIATELCRCWDDMESLREYSLVVLVRLQDKKFQEARHIVELFYHPNIPLQQAVAREVVERDGEGTLLIFDGVDQLPPSSRRSHLVAQVLEGSVLQKAKVVLTSCTTSSSSATLGIEELLSECKTEVGRHVEVLGFAQEEIEQHVESSCSSDSVQVDELSTYLSANPALHSSMHVPFNCSIVVEAYKQAARSGRAPPKTMSQVYLVTVQQILRHYMLVKGIGNQRPPPLSLHHGMLEDLPTKVYQQLCSLAQFAFSALLKQETVFHKLPRSCNPFGFMQATPELHLPKKDAAVAYSFLDVGLQQYLAAFHLSRLPSSEQKEVFQQYMGSPHLNQVWQFLAGITGMRGSLWELVKTELVKTELWANNSSLSTLLLRCLHEAQERLPCESVLGSRKIVFPQAHYGEEILPRDIFALGWCLVHSRCTLSLRLRLDTEQLRMLSLGLRASSTSSGNSRASIIDTLYLRPPVSKATMSTLSNLPPTAAIHGLDLSHCELEAPVLNALAPVVPKLKSLRHLDIRGNQVGDGGLVKLLHALSNNSQLQSLSMINTGIGSKDVAALSLLTSPRQSLKELRIGDEGMTDDIVDSLVSSVFETSSLHCLHLWFTNLTSNADLLAKLLKTNSNINSLEFHACKLGSNGCTKLAEALKTNTTLRTLVLSMFDVPSLHQIGTEGAVAFADMLRTNPKLEYLELPFDRSMGRHGALALVDSLKHNYALKHLKLPQQHFEPVEIPTIDTRVRWSGP